MFLVDPKWYEAAQMRKSKRRYTDKKVEKHKLESLNRLTDEINAASSGVRFIYKEENSDSIFKGLVGSYGKIQNAPTYIAFIGDQRDKNIEDKIGYYGEAFILQATKLGLGTCWVSGSYNPEVVKDRIGLKEGEKVYGVSPVGYIPDDIKFGEKLIGLIGNKRKSITDIYEGEDYDKNPQWIKTAIELARMAPSATNRQPWRFRPINDGIIVSKDNNNENIGVSKRLDCGIAMLHIELGALHEGVRGKWEYMDDPDIAVYYRGNKVE